MSTRAVRVSGSHGRHSGRGGDPQPAEGRGEASDSGCKRASCGRPEVGTGEAGRRAGARVARGAPRRQPASAGSAPRRDPGAHGLLLKPQHHPADPRGPAEEDARVHTSCAARAGTPSGRPLSVEQNESTRAPNSRPERSLIRREPPAHVASVSAAGAGVSALRPLASSRLPARPASRASLRYSESGGGGPDPGTKAAAAPTRFGPAPHLRRPLTGLGPRGRHLEWLVTSRRFVWEMPRGDDERGMPRVWRTTETPWRNG